jgi:hypothetical protein
LDEDLISQEDKEMQRALMKFTSWEVLRLFMSLEIILRCLNSKIKVIIDPESSTKISLLSGKSRKIYTNSLHNLLKHLRDFKFSQ